MRTRSPHPGQVTSEGLHWEALDADISLPGILARLLNVHAWAGQYLGARTNGRKGGRPRKPKPGPSTAA